MSIVPFIVLFIMIYTYGVNIPFFDDWAFVDLIDKYLSGSLTFQDLWGQHNEHRPFTVKVATLVSACLTNWNLVSMMMFSVFVAFLTFVIIAFQIGRTFRSLKIGGYGLLIIFSSLMLSGLSQYENWTWGTDTCWFLVNFFAVCCFVLLSRASCGLSCFVLATVCAVLSFMSMAHGLLAFVVGIFILMMRPNEHYAPVSSKNLGVVIWAIMTISVALIYFGNLERQADSPSITGFLQNPVVFLKYVGAYPASALLRDIEFEALILGSISLVLFGIAALITIRKMWRDPKYYWAFMPWVSIGFYVAGTACMAAIGRHNYGWNHALCGRYTTMSALFYVALVVLLWGLIRDCEAGKKRENYWGRIGLAANIVVSVMIGLSIFSSIRMFHYFPDFMEKRLVAMDTLLKGGDRKNLLLIFPDAEYVVQKNEVLKHHRLSFYR